MAAAYVNHKQDVVNPYRLAPGEILIKLLINHPDYFVSQDNGQLFIKLPNHANPAFPGAYIIQTLTGVPLTNDSIMLNEFLQEEAEVIIEVYKYLSGIPGRFHRQENINAEAAAAAAAAEQDRMFPNAKQGIEDPNKLTPGEALIKLLRRYPIFFGEERGNLTVQLPPAIDPEHRGYLRFDSLLYNELSAETILANRFSPEEQVTIINIFKQSLAAGAPMANLPNNENAPAVRGRRLRGVPRGGKYTRRIRRVRYGRPSKKTRSRHVQT